MNSRKFENRLSYLAALIVLIGVTWAAGAAFAEPAMATTAATAASKKSVSPTVVIAREAMTEAAAEAALALKAENAFDLDTQLTDIKSTSMAAGK